VIVLPLVTNHNVDSSWLTNAMSGRRVTGVYGRISVKAARAYLSSSYSASATTLTITSLVTAYRPNLWHAPYRLHALYTVRQVELCGLRAASWDKKLSCGREARDCVCRWGGAQGHWKWYHSNVKQSKCGFVSRTRL